MKGSLGLALSTHPHQDPHLSLSWLTDFCSVLQTCRVSIGRGLVMVLFEQFKDWPHSPQFLFLYHHLPPFLFLTLSSFGLCYSRLILISSVDLLSPHMPTLLSVFKVYVKGTFNLCVPWAQPPRMSFLCCILFLPLITTWNVAAYVFMCAFACSRGNNRGFFWLRCLAPSSLPGT